jgi:phosphotriesterase-related protein
VPIHTVLGPIEPTELGRTSMHEHLLIDVRPQYAPSPEVLPDDLRVSIENLGTVRWNVNAIPDNLIIDDVELVVSELAEMTMLGASAVVDLTINGLGPRVHDLVTISQRTGLHVLVGCGFYIHGSHPEWLETASVDEIEEFFRRELQAGIDGSGIVPALVGEIGTSHPVTDREAKVVRAAGRAAAHASAAVNIHLDPRGRHALEILEILVAEGVPADRVVFSHLDECLDWEYHEAIAKAGAILEYDAFGQEWYYSPDRYKDPSDEERCVFVERLVADGHAAQLVLACDVCMKSCLKAYGGMGCDHLFRRIVPYLLERFSVDEDDIEQMLVHTPRRLLDRPAT